MPLPVNAGRPSILVRKEAYETKGLVRADLDSRLNLTDQEFHVEGQLIVIGPLPSDDSIGPLTDYLEGAGLVYFDDFFEMSGNWPEWVRVFVSR